MNKFTGIVRRCIDDYAMINDGDRIAVGISGGKDSLALLCALANLRKFYPKKFELYGISVSMGFVGMDYTPVHHLCENLGIPYKLIETDLAQIIFEQRREKNPCSLCANMRRGALNNALIELGLNKLALGHHFDDAIETFLMSLLYEGRLNCFQPVTYLSRSKITQIRPMLYVGEGTIKNVAEKYKLPVVHNPCPQNGSSKREEIKQLIRRLSVQYPDLKTKIFGSIQRLPLPGWSPERKI